jgi:Ala-tRNA(Pro) deacylase
MTEIATRVREFLEENEVEYEQIHHHRDFNAMETAEHTHTPGKQFAKAVVTRIAGEFAMAVLPSNHTVDPERFASALAGKKVAIASEEEVDRLFPDCEKGAVPPFGNLYGLPVYVSPALSKAEQITCVAGSHAEAIRLSYRDFERLVQPRELDLSVVYHGGPPSAA